MKILDKLLSKLATKFVTKQLEKMLGKSWKTSLGGIGAIVGGIGALLSVIAGAVIALTDGNPDTTFSFSETKELIGIAIVGISGGIAALKARDSDVTSLQAGAEK